LCECSTKYRLCAGISIFNSVLLKSGGVRGVT
jgi:hypothetical protein